MGKHDTDLVRRIRAGFVLQGTTLTAFCRQNDIDPANFRKALQGEWNGPKGRQVRDLVIRASGSDERLDH